MSDDRENIGVLVLLRFGQRISHLIVDRIKACFFLLCIRKSVPLRLCHFVNGFVQEQITEACAAGIVIRQLVENVVNKLRPALVLGILGIVVFTVLVDGGKKTFDKRNDLLTHLAFHQLIILHIHESEVCDCVFTVRCCLIAEIDFFVALGADFC